MSPIKPRALKYFLIIFLVFLIGLFISNLNVIATPDKDDNPYRFRCHDSEGYTIETTATSPIITNSSINISITVKATGSSLFIRPMPGAEDNLKFTFSPTSDWIIDNLQYDDNNVLGAMTVRYNITTPSEDGIYQIFFLAGNNAQTPPNFAFLKVEINVGNVPSIIGFNYLLIILSVIMTISITAFIKKIEIKK